VNDGWPRLAPRVERQLVEETRAERAPEDEHDARVLVQAEPPTSLGALDRVRRRRNRASDRAVLLPVQAEWQGEEDMLGERRREPVGEPEVRICLGERARNPAQPRGQHHRPSDEAAAAEDGVRSAAAENAATRERRCQGLAHGAYELGPQPSWQPGDGECVELVAVFRNEPRLDAIRRPGERYEPVPATQRFGDGQCRRDVSDRPAGRDQEPQLPLARHYGRC
jgi:hypothetical protein